MLGDMSVEDQVNKTCQVNYSYESANVPHVTSYGVCPGADFCIIRQLAENGVLDTQGECVEGEHYQSNAHAIGLS